MTEQVEKSTEQVTLSEQDIKVGKMMQGLATGINEVMKETLGHAPGFCLVMFTDNRTQYVSNSNRDDVFAELRKVVESYEAGKDGPSVIDLIEEGRV